MIEHRTYAEADGLFIMIYDARRCRVGLVRFDHVAVDTFFAHSQARYRRGHLKPGTVWIMSVLRGIIP